MECGVQCVVTHGALGMPQLCADNSDNVFHDCSNLEDLGVCYLGKTLFCGLCDSTHIDKRTLSISC